MPRLPHEKSARVAMATASNRAADKDSSNASHRYSARLNNRLVPQRNNLAQKVKAFLRARSENAHLTGSNAAINRPTGVQAAAGSGYFGSCGVRTEST
jgi:hypothetical protein